MTITTDTYGVLQKAYNHFNKHIFQDDLPQCLITLAAHRRAYGYFRYNSFQVKKKQTDEIALNPFTFEGRTDHEILSTLTHEMVHLWQHHFGEVKKTHHSKQWADKMEEIGLMPSSTGKEGGRRTGKRVSHYIIKDGLFDKVGKKFKNKLNIKGYLTQSEKKGRKRTKYTCPDCETNAYGKPQIFIICGDCQETMRENR